MSLTLQSIVMCSALASEPALTLETILNHSTVVDGPALRPQGDAVAYVLNAAQDAYSISPFKTAGDLVVKTNNGELWFNELPRVRDPVWSPDGAFLALSSGFGDSRRLIVLRWPFKDDSVFLDLTIPDSEPVKSARFYPPIWVADSASLIIAEAVTRRARAAQRTPYSTRSRDADTVFDEHFRDRTQWRLLRVGLAGRVDQLTKPEPLRSLYLSPDTQILLLEVEDLSQPGTFAGDTYVRPHNFRALDLANNREKPLPVSGVINVHRIDDHQVIFSNQVAVKQLALPSMASETVLTLEANQSVLAVSPEYIVTTTRLCKQPDRERFLNPPPCSERLEFHGRESAPTYVPAQMQSVEVVDSAWAGGDARLLVLLRHLETMHSSVVLVDPGARRSTTVFSGPVSVEGNLQPTSTGSIVLRAHYSSGRVDLLELTPDSSGSLAVHSTSLAQAMAAAVAPIHLTYVDKAGGAQKALLYLPRNHRPGAATPLVVTGYGRLYTQRFHFFREAQLHVARGYAFLAPDVFVQRGDLGLAYLQSIPAAVTVARKEYALRGRLGFYGGSLGGFAGLTLLTRSTILDAAALRAPPSEFAMSWATGKDRDANLLEYLLHGATPYTGSKTYRDNSALWSAEAINAPLLLLHGDNDMQVPLAQSVGLFQALRRLGETAELRIYPNADHSIIRGNRAYFLDYYSSILGWWDSHLHAAKTL